MSEIESVKPILTVIDDEGDLILNSTGPRGKAMVQAVLALANDVRKISVISDGEMKVMKRNGAAVNQAKIVPDRIVTSPVQRPTASVISDAPDIQDQFAADLEYGLTGEQAMGETPSPTPGPSDPVKIPAGTGPAVTRRKPQIFQDAAAPPAPELAEAEMERLLQEAAQAEADAARVAEDQRFQRQQAVQAAGRGPADQVEPSDVPAEQSAESSPARRKREPRSLATTGRACGRCGGGGQIVGDAGFQGACPVCHGEGQVKTWDRSLKVR